MRKIIHITSAHNRFDTRIFLKECRSLASSDYDVSLIVADGLPDETIDKINIYGVRKESNRFLRMLKIPGMIYKKAIALNADIYHLHDPELLPIGLKLKKRGKKVIFDSHEDYPKQILNKPYLNKLLSKIISKLYAIFEKYSLLKFDYIVTATPFIQEKISQWHSFVIDINNYPLTDEFFNIPRAINNTDDKFYICYVGGISRIRGIREMVKAMEYCTNDVQLFIAGDFESKNLQNEIIKIDGWNMVNDLGFLSRKDVAKIFELSVAGLLIFLPNQNHIDSQPNKLFEYMSAGLPVIASNFQLWKNIIENNNCGICVDPNKPEEIASAIDLIINNKKLALQMGNNGKKMILQKYNWDIEKVKLLTIYDYIK